MKNIIFLFLIFSSTYIIAQPYNPYFGKNFSSCFDCNLENIVDQINDGYRSVYCKYKYEDIELETYRISDSTFFIRKYKNSFLIERGKVILKENEIAVSDTISSFNCHDYSIGTTISICHYYTPFKYGNWYFNDSSNAKITGTFDKNENKIKKWTYTNANTSVVKDYETNDHYILHPTEIDLTENKNYFLGKFYVNEFISKKYNAENILEYINKVKKLTLKNNKSKEYINYKIEIYKNGKLQFVNIKNPNDKATYEWEIEENTGDFLIYDDRNQIFSYDVLKIGKSEISFIKE